MTPKSDEVPASGKPPGAGTAASGARFAAARAAVVAADDLTPAERRRALTKLADRWLGELLPETTGVALVAVGGYGRRELLPGSDLDLVLVHDGSRSQDAVRELAESVFYPLWDAAIPLDHSVRTPSEARDVAAGDIKAMLGMLDSRHVVGDARLTAELRTQVLADWRSRATGRLMELRSVVEERTQQHGELAYLLEPDLSQSYGGLRDTTVLRGIAASWVADYPNRKAVAEARSWLLNVRESLHRTTGRSSDRLLLHDQDAVAADLGMLGADVLLRRVSEAGRAIAYSSDLTWREVGSLTSRPRLRLRRPTRRPVADGVLVQDGQVVLARNVRPEDSSVLPLRTAAAAAQHDLVLGPRTAELLAHRSPPLPEPWPRAAREAFVSLLAAGRPAVRVWETLEWAGLVTDWLPGWERIRFRPQRTPAHRYTVDRHSIEAAVAASSLTRRVSRPDLLLVAALLHDIGKGWPGDHSEVGAPLAADIAARMGFDNDDVDVIKALVRHHLLLPDTATRRDLDDPATVALVVDRIRSRRTLDLLAALTEADALATGPMAWTPWRSGLIADLVRRAGAAMDGQEVPKEPPLRESEEQLVAAGGMHVVVAPGRSEGVWRVTVVTPDRPGLLADVAGVLALHRLHVRSASLSVRGSTAVQVLHTEARSMDPEAKRIQRDLTRVLDGEFRPEDRLAGRRHGTRSGAATPPRVEVRPEASRDATVVEIRATDQPALLNHLGRAVAETGATISSAVVGTVGTEAIDVLYLVDSHGGPLSEQRAALVRSHLSRVVQSIAT